MTIHNVQDLLDYFLAANPQALNKKVNKYVSCGASISFYLQDGTSLHKEDKWLKLQEIENVGLKGFTIQTEVEGHHLGTSMFTLPVESKKIDDWMNNMEVTAEWIWEEHHDSIERD